MGHVKQGEDVMKIYKNPQLHHQPFNPFLEHAVAVVRRYRL